MNDDDYYDTNLPEEEQIGEERVSGEELLELTGLDVTIGELEVLRPPISCESGTTIRDAIQTMVAERLGFILIVENERLIGIFTERDLLTTIAAGDVDIDTTTVDTVMTAQPECLQENYKLVYAINQMSVAGYRHIPIVDEDGRPKHVVSARNVVEHFAEKFQKEILNLPPDPNNVAPARVEGG